MGNDLSVERGHFDAYAKLKARVGTAGEGGDARRGGRGGLSEYMRETRKELEEIAAVDEELIRRLAEMSKLAQEAMTVNDSLAQEKKQGKEERKGVVTSLNAQLNSLSEQLRKKDVEISRANAKLSTAEEKASRYEGRLRDSLNKTKDLEERVRRLTTENEVLRIKAAGAEEGGDTTGALDDHIGRKTAEINSLRREIRDLTDKNESLHSSLEDARGKAAVLERKLNIAEDELRTKAGGNWYTVDRLRSTKEQLLQREREISELREKLEKTSRENEKLRMRISVGEKKAATLFAEGGEAKGSVYPPEPTEVAKAAKEDPESNELATMFGQLENLSTEIGGEISGRTVEVNDLQHRITDAVGHLESIIHEINVDLGSGAVAES